MRNVSILGCGWLGTPLAISFLDAGFKVKGSTTSNAKIDDLEALGIQTYLDKPRFFNLTYIWGP